MDKNVGIKIEASEVVPGIITESIRQILEAEGIDQAVKAKALGVLEVLAKNVKIENTMISNNMVRMDSNDG